MPTDEQLCNEKRIREESTKIVGHWKVHTPNLLQEIMSNPTTGILQKPVTIFQELLRKVAERASELDDKRLNQLMMRLALYEVSDPESKEYDSEFVQAYLT